MKTIIQWMIVLLFVVYIGITFFGRNSLCPSTQVTASIHPLWKINGASINAEIVWEYPLTTDDNFLAVSQSSVAFYRGNNGSPCNDGETIIALNATSGKEIWRYPVTLVYSLLGFKDGYLVSTCCSSVMRIDEKGERIWQSALFPDKDLRGRLTFIENKVYSSIGNGYSLDLETGATLADRLTPEEQNKFDLQYVPQYDVYLRLDQTKILAFHISDGLPAWDIHENFKANPIILGNRVITFDQSNTIKIFDVQNGDQMGEIKLTSNIIPSKNDLQRQFSILAAYGNTIFILDSETAKLFAIRLE